MESKEDESQTSPQVFDFPKINSSTFKGLLIFLKAQEVVGPESCLVFAMFIQDRGLSSYEKKKKKKLAVNKLKQNGIVKGPTP